MASTGQNDPIVTHAGQNGHQQCAVFHKRKNRQDRASNSVSNLTRHDLIWAESTATKALITVSSVTAASPVPGGQPFAAVVNKRLGVPLVSDVDDRWEWIETDMIGAFTDNVVAVDPDLDPVFRARIGDVVNERRFPVLRDLVDYEPAPL